MEEARSRCALSRPHEAVRRVRGHDRKNRGRRAPRRRRGNGEVQGSAAAAGRHPVHRRLCEWRLRVAELTYRDAVARGIAQEMARDPDVIFFGEDVAKAGGVFKATVGLYEQFGPRRVRDTPISEQAILGAPMGAAMTGLKPIAGIRFPDFFAVCFDYIANDFAKSRYISNGQL